MADVAFCVKLKMNFSITTGYNTDFGGNSFVEIMAFITFWNQTLNIYIYIYIYIALVLCELLNVMVVCLPVFFGLLL